eukprot:TRINITY_DN423_c0_g1_i2.p1 TRINITY_DN423_c0_g1~~TRINITY_DN423_c0_g1_i2.p1  ORF type:complete len:207 (-),score=50.42 TRINITY_DN423_c0_g1_i2:37-657(-)
MESDQVDWEEKYMALVAKYNLLLDKSADMAEELYRTKKAKVKLAKQRNYILDKFLESQGRTERSELKLKNKRKGLCKATVASGRPCKVNALRGSEYCRHHAALDPNNEYQFCEHKDSSSGKGCLNSVKKTADVKYCIHHRSLYEGQNGAAPTVNSEATGIASTLGVDNVPSLNIVELQNTATIGVPVATDIDKMEVEEITESMTLG